MNPEKVKRKIEELLRLPHETEWVEFKHNYCEPDRIGRDISALSNSACLHHQPAGYILWGIEDKTGNVKGTTFQPKQMEHKKQGLENWLMTLLGPKLEFKFYEDEINGAKLVLLEIQAASQTPVSFDAERYIRVGSHTRNLRDLPEKERQIWQSRRDWSAQICKDATIRDLSPDAVAKARLEYKVKNPRLADDSDKWDDAVFLDKAKITMCGQITNAAVVLLGLGESKSLISPAVAHISWILNEDGVKKDYEHFGPPFILQVDRVLGKIRNLRYRYLPDSTLFPIEIDQYDLYVIREVLHNCIAHQDYDLCGRIFVIEKKDELVFQNPGTFLPGSVEAVIRQDCPYPYYRNKFLADAMVNLNMIDTVGGGIKKIFLAQKNRYFPLPDYEFESGHGSNPPSVTVKIQGKILDENYTKLLIRRPDLQLEDVMLLDKVQKHIKITKEECNYLRKRHLVEGRYPSLYISSSIASEVTKKAQYIRNRGLDNQYYINLILSFLDKYHQASRKELDDLLIVKLPDVLSEEQKRNRISNLLYRLSKKDNLIINKGTSRAPKWVKR